MRAILLAVFVGLVVPAGPASAQTTKEAPPPLSDDTKKAQQNAADEAGIKGKLEDGIAPGPPSEQAGANKKLEDAAAKAKSKSDAKKGK